MRTVVAGLSAAAIFAVCGSVAGTLPASAATSSAAAVAGVSGATRVSAGEVDKGNGAVILRASPDNIVITPTLDWGYNNGQAGYTLTCTSGYFCAWGATNDGGICWMFVKGGTLDWLYWGAYSATYCGSVGTWSWANDTGYRVWKEQYSTPGGSLDFPTGLVWTGNTPSGNSWCIKPHVSNSDVGDNSTRTMGWIYMSDNTSSC